MGAKRRKRPKGHNRTTTCPKCDKKYKGKQGLAVHMYKAHASATLDLGIRASKEETRLEEFHVPSINSVTVNNDAVIIHYGTRKL